MNVLETSLRVVSRDRPVSWDEKTSVSCHTVLISLIIKSSVKQNLMRAKPNGYSHSNSPLHTSQISVQYLGLPISDKRLRKSDLMSWIDKIGNKLPRWQAAKPNFRAIFGTANLR
jgi:hypothetical protein